MIRNLKTVASLIIAIACFFSIALAILILVPASAEAQNQAPAQTTTQRCTTYKNQFTIGNGSTSIIGDIPVYCSATSLILPLISYGLGISGTVAMLFVIVGGFFYVASAGNEEQAEKGKKILINAAIGLVVIIMSFAIVRIITGALQ